MAFVNPTKTSAKLAFFAGAMAVALAPGLALAPLLALAPGLAYASPREMSLPPLPPANPLPPPARPAPPNDALQGGGFYIEADELVDDDANHTVTAIGQVEARYGGRVLRADKVTYDTVTGVATANGHVAIVNEDGTTEYSQSAILDRQMSLGVAAAFSSRLQDNISMAAANVVRRSPTLNELNEAVFTPCPVCAEKPKPTWFIRARKVVQDKKKKLIVFHDATVVVHGLPVFYTPVMWAPTPDQKQQSGLLAPEISTNSMRGFSWEQPYLQILSPSEDLIVSPQINSKVNPFLNLDWRDRFYSGAIDVRAGYTDEQNFNSEGDKLGDLTSRSYVLSKGLFEITPDWQWGFTGEYATDPLIFDKYGVADPFIDRGLYSADDRRLISQLFSTFQTQDTYVSVAAMEVEGLRSTDIQSQFPGVAPLIEARYEPDQSVFGGRLLIEGSGVALWRDQSPTVIGLPGIDSQRGTFEANWQSTYIFSNGLRLDPFLDWRGDLYGLQKLPEPYDPNAVIFRNLPTAGVTASWPFLKRDGGLTYIVEPIAQLAISPFLGQDPRIPDEDSLDFQFDETNLFDMDKSPGFDLIDSGQRLNVGARFTVEDEDGQSASALLGRSFRAEPDPYLPARTGLAGEESDWIVAASFNPLNGMTFFSRMRLDSNSYSINYLETGADFATSRIDGQVRYLQEAEDPDGQRVNDLDFHGEFFVTKNWGVSAYGATEFTSGVWREEDIGIVYKDECIRVEILYDRNDTTNGVLGPSQGVSFRLSLATLGNSGYVQPAVLSPLRESGADLPP